MIKAIIGLGNPGSQYDNNRHNIGFRILDALAYAYCVDWQKKELMHTAEIPYGHKKILLVKPQTFMNDSGRVIPELRKRGIKDVDQLLVVHDELELPFGQLRVRTGGSSRGHNGLKSIIQFCGPDFMRLRFGIGRPERKEDVSTYVLHNFSEQPERVDELIDESVQLIESTIGETEAGS